MYSCNLCVALTFPLGKRGSNPLLGRGRGGGPDVLWVYLPKATLAHLVPGTPRDLQEAFVQGQVVPDRVLEFKKGVIAEFKFSKQIMWKYV
jgi:hypothetical protein